jgi:hypothetical protein
MTNLIIVFGVLTLIAGIIIIINPEKIFGVLNKHIETLGLYILAVVVRLVLGALLIYQADVSKYPLIIEVLGWLSIVAALSFIGLGRKDFKRVMSWAMSLAKPLGRIAGVFAACFGAFLIHAFV